MSDEAKRETVKIQLPQRPEAKPSPGPEPGATKTPSKLEGMTDDTAEDMRHDDHEKTVEAVMPHSIKALLTLMFVSLVGLVIFVWIEHSRSERMLDELLSVDSKQTQMSDQLEKTQKKVLEMPGELFKLANEALGGIKSGSRYTDTTTSQVVTLENFKNFSNEIRERMDAISRWQTEESEKIARQHLLTEMAFNTISNKLSTSDTTLTNIGRQIANVQSTAEVAITNAANAFEKATNALATAALAKDESKKALEVAEEAGKYIQTRIAVNYTISKGTNVLGEFVITVTGFLNSGSKKVYKNGDSTHAERVNQLIPLLVGEACLDGNNHLKPGVQGPIMAYVSGKIDKITALRKIKEVIKPDDVTRRLTQKGMIDPRVDYDLPPQVAQQTPVQKKASK